MTFRSVFAIANELLAASGADKILGINFAVEHDGLSALGIGTGDLKAFVVAITIAVAITVAIAITITIAVAVIAAAIVELFLERSEILVDLLDVIVQILEIVIGLVLSCCNVGNDIDECIDELSFCGLLIKLKSFCKALYIGCLFNKCHNNLHSAVIMAAQKLNFWYA